MHNYLKSTDHTADGYGTAATKEMCNQFSSVK